VERSLLCGDRAEVRYTPYRLVRASAPAMTGHRCVDPGAPIAALGFFALIIFHLVVGWQTYRLSRATEDASKALVG